MMLPPATLTSRWYGHTEQPLDDLLGIDLAAQYTGGDIQGLAAFDASPAEIQRLVLDEALQRTLTGEREVPEPSRVQAQLEVERTVRGNETTAALSEELWDMLDPWRDATEVAATASVATMVESLVFDSLDEGVPTNQQIDAAPEESTEWLTVDPSVKVVRALRNTIILGERRSTAHGIVEDQLVVGAFFSDRGVPATVRRMLRRVVQPLPTPPEKGNPQELFFNRFGLSHRWRLESVRAEHRTVIVAIGSRATDKAIAYTRASVRSDAPDKTSPGNKFSAGGHVYVNWRTAGARSDDYGQSTGFGYRGNEQHPELFSRPGRGKIRETYAKVSKLRDLMPRAAGSRMMLAAIS